MFCAKHKIRAKVRIFRELMKTCAKKSDDFRSKRGKIKGKKRQTFCDSCSCRRKRFCDNIKSFIFAQIFK